MLRCDEASALEEGAKSIGHGIVECGNQDGVVEAKLPH